VASCHRPRHQHAQHRQSRRQTRDVGSYWCRGR